MTLFLALLRRYWLHIVIVVAIAWALHAAYGFAYRNGYNAANVRAEKIIGDFAKAEADAQARARKAEQAAGNGIAAAQDEAGKRNEQIESDYQRRIAGVVSDRDRLRKLWQAERATDQLADSAAAVAATAEQDRLRRESAARIVRAVEQVQSERDEVIDRYEAVRAAINGKQ